MTDDRTPPTEQPTRRMPAAYATSAPGPAIAAGSLVVALVSRGPSHAPGASAAVPNVIGLSQGDALGKLQEAGFAAQVFNDYSSAVSKGRVMGQLPDFGQGAPAGSAAVLMVSSGPSAADEPLASLPDVVGLTEAEVASRLNSAGLRSRIVHDFSPNVPEGIAMAQLPSAHSLAALPPKRSLLWLWLLIALIAILAIGGFWYAQNRGASDAGETTSTPEATSTVSDLVEVPDVEGMTEAKATTVLEAAGFAAVTTNVTTADSPAGTVVAQVPAAGEELTRGSNVAIQIAQAVPAPVPTGVTVPNVVGMTQGDAQDALIEVGLTPSFVTQANEAAKGTALEQQPAGGDAAQRDDVVIVALSSGVAPAPATVDVPNVIGKTQADAVKALTEASLTSQIVQGPDADAPNGTVFLQWPPAGKQVAPATPVAVVVSTGP